MAENNQNQVPPATTQVGVFGQFLGFVEKHGIFKTILYTLTFAFFSLTCWFLANPVVIFEKYEKYVTEKHMQSTEYRMQSSPLIRNYLNQMSLETGANRVYIIEYHNGKSNPTGLQWQYGDMTFINDAAVDIRDEFQNISLVKYPIFYELYEYGMWIGSIEELYGIDKRYAFHLEINEVKSIAYTVLYSMNLSEIGILGISYIEGDTPLCEEVLRKTLRKYATSISPLLDGAEVSEKLIKR